MFMYMREIAKRRNSDEGASAVEYGLLVAAIAAVVILLVFAIGTYVKGAFKTTCDAFSSAGTTRVGTTGSCTS